MNRCYRFILPILGLMATNLFSQDFRGTLTGRVVDPSNAPVPEASITVKNEGTNIAATAKTDGRGNFTVSFLPPGSYTLTVSSAGFKVAKRSEIQVTVAQTSTEDVKLELGNVSQEVTVTAEGAVVESANADRGGLIDAEAVAEYPLNGRNPFMLSMLVPGVDYNGELAYQRPFDNGAIARWNINGSGSTGSSGGNAGSGSASNNEFLLDGAPNNAQAGGNNIAYVPPVDSVQEFKIMTNAYDAQYGKTGGGVVNVALKSGGNKLHGTVYEFMRRNSFDANSFQNNARKAPKDGHLLDQYGGQADGPVFIPKIYDGRNKTFFLANYEGYREATPQPLVLNFPEMDMRRGDFTKLVDGGGNKVTIYDPTTTSPTIVSGKYPRQPFPNNTIPSSRINPISTKILSFYPEPNTKTGGLAYGQSNYFASGGENPAKDTFYNLVFKFDQNIGSRNHLFFRHGSNDRTEFRSTNGIRDKVGGDGPQPLKRINDAYVLDWVHTLSPTMIVNPRISFSRYIESNAGLANQDFDLTTLGFPAKLAAALPYNPGFGQYAFTDYTSIGKASPSRNVTNTWATAISLTKVSGSRTTKVGWDMRWIQYATQNPGTVFNLTGNKTFTQADYTQADALSGNSIAGFLLGTPSSGTINYNSFYIYMQRYMAPWIQQDLKLTSKLTVNLGLRFDFNVPPNERFNRLNVGFDTEVVNPVDKLVNHTTSPDLPDPVRGGLLFSGINGARATAADLYMNTWQPRIGAAYAIARNTVLRGGWGRYYVNPSNNFQQATGYNAQTTMTVSPDGNRTTYPNMINDPFPIVNQPRGAADGLLTYVGRSFNFVNSAFHTPHVDMFSVGFQRAVFERGRFEITYSGSRGKDLEATKAFDEQGDGAFRDSCNPLLGHPVTFCNAGVTNPFRNLDAFIGTNWYTANTVNRNQILRPFPQYTGLTEYMLNTGASWYNSLQTLFTYRTRKGMNLNINYTFAKNMVRSGYLDPQNEVMQQGLVQYDKPHRFVTSMISQLPMGKGHKLFGNTHGWTSKLLSGWENTIIFSISSGQPWPMPSNAMYLKDAKIPYEWGQEKVQAIKPCTIKQNDDFSMTVQANAKAYGCTDMNWLMYNTTYNPRYTPYFDGRIRLQTMFMADTSLNKITQITERFRVQFRAEAFNIANSFFINSLNFNSTPDNANFGIVYKSTASAPQSNYPRQLQLGFKLLW